ncbi:MAG TPA: L-threonylcarbamoyladenylate synthase [Verrucomicrobiae bacterium]|nr:L-threonylcarbamoyladenylate synthase [Verrucomicrobiae bacterium]
MNHVVHVNAKAPEQEVMERAAAILRGGGLVAFPTETVYGLGALALNLKAIHRIFTAKERPDWDPLIVHVRDAAMARSLMKTVPQSFESLASRFWPGPLTFVVEKADLVPGEVTAHRPTVALRMPGHPVAAALLTATGAGIAAPSANRFGRPSPTRAQHVLEDLADRVDLILDAGPTPMGVESTVLDLTQSPPAILRPGGVPREELEKVLGEVTLASIVEDEVARKGLAGPGMSIRHYSPRARIELLDGTAEEAVVMMKRRVEELKREGKTFYIMSNYGDSQLYAQTLFDQMREADRQQADVILAILPPASGLGLAVRDRLQRAAGSAPVKKSRSRK